MRIIDVQLYHITVLILLSAPEVFIVTLVCPTSILTDANSAERLLVVVRFTGSVTVKYPVKVLK